MLTAPESTNHSRSAADAAERRAVAVALLIGVLIVAASLLRHDGDIAGLIKFGEGANAQVITEHVEDVLGREVATVEAGGHDGKFFFLQALDPLFLNPNEHAAQLDRPIYRSQRMLFPAIAGVGGLLSAEAAMWSMAIVNLVAIAADTMAAGRIAQRLGGSAWLGLSFSLNPGIVFEFDVSGAGIVAFACAAWGTLAVMDRRNRAAIGWFVAAVLAREVMLLYLAGVCCHRLWTDRRIPWLIGGIPFLSVVAWAGYIRLRLDVGTGVDEVQEFGVPFGGMADALGNWLSNPSQIAVIACLVAAMPLLVVRAIQRPNPLAWGALGFVLLAIFMTRQVWWNFFDITRAVAPIITAFVITAFSDPQAARPAWHPRQDSNLQPSG